MPAQIKVGDKVRVKDVSCLPVSRLYLLDQEGTVRVIRNHEFVDVEIPTAHLIYPLHIDEIELV